jgi:ketol-acid reductoisomerase
VKQRGRLVQFLWGESFNLSEQATSLLQQAFETLSKASCDPAKVLEEVQAKGKGVVSLEVVEEGTIMLPMQNQRPCD